VQRPVQRRPLPQRSVAKPLCSPPPGPPWDGRAASRMARPHPAAASRSRCILQADGPPSDTGSFPRVGPRTCSCAHYPASVNYFRILPWVFCQRPPTSVKILHARIPCRCRGALLLASLGLVLPGGLPPSRGPGSRPESARLHPDPGGSRLAKHVKSCLDYRQPRRLFIHSPSSSFHLAPEPRNFASRGAAQFEAAGSHVLGRACRPVGNAWKPGVAEQRPLPPAIHFRRTCFRPYDSLVTDDKSPIYRYTPARVTS